MSNPFRPISISFIPNYSLPDVLQAFLLLCQPWNYFNTSWTDQFSTALKNYIQRKHVILFESGRDAEYFLLKALGIKSGDEVIIQAFTCVAVPNSTLWNGAKPVYVDIDESFNIDPQKLERLVTSKTKAVIVQHTLGTPAKIAAIAEICRKNKIILLEDCAHGFGNSLNGKKLGSFGLATFYSFGRDKVISGVWGGAVKTDDESLALKLEDLAKVLPQRSFGWVVMQLGYILASAFILETYSFFNLGKMTHLALHKAGLLSLVIKSPEKQGEHPEKFYKGPVGALAYLANIQLQKIDDFIVHRKKLARFYSNELGADFNEESSYLRFPLLVTDPNSLRKFAAKKNIFLGDWYDTVIAPIGTNIEAIGYKKGSCSVAERISERIVNLPTNPKLSLKGAAKVVAVVKLWKSKK